MGAGSSMIFPCLLRFLLVKVVGINKILFDELEAATNDVDI